MKKLQALLSLFVLLLLTACKASQEVQYFQDLADRETVKMQAVAPLRFAPGDKLTIVVTSSATPELATQYNLPNFQTQLGQTTFSRNNNSINAYTVSEQGTVNMPAVGTIQVQGMTALEVGEHVQTMLRKEMLRDAVVVVEAYGQYVTVMGEVNRPGRFAIERNSITLLEALGQAGDLTIKGRRDNVMVIRQEGNLAKSYYVDLRSKNLLRSPVYNLKQNDVVYVVPNRMRAGEANVNDNSFRSVGTWISIGSFLLTLGVLVFR